MTSHLLIAVAAMAAQAEPPLIPAFFTGEALHDICRRSEPGLCWMYVAGVLDGFFHSDSSREEARYCRAQLTNAEAAAAVRRRLEEDPELHRRAAAVAVEMALRERLACE